MPSKSKLEHFKLVLETHVAETERIIENAEQEVRASSVKHADTADQAAVVRSKRMLLGRRFEASIKLLTGFVGEPSANACNAALI